MDVNSKSPELLNQSLSESGKRTLAISTQAKSVDPESLMKEAEATRQYIVENGLDKLILVGHSQGGVDAINLATLLQEKNPEIKVEGIVLVDSVGLYEQGSFELARKFIQDAGPNTTADVIKNLSGTALSKIGIRKSERDTSFMGRSLKAGQDIGKGIYGAIRQYGLEYVLKRFPNEVKEMASKSKNLDKLTVPIILVNGERDIVSAPTRVMPKEEQDRITQARQERVDLAREERKDLPKGERWPQDPNWKDETGEFMRENVFPHSPYVRRIIASKEGEHGLSLWRDVAKASLFLIERSQKTSNIQTKFPRGRQPRDEVDSSIFC